MGYESTSKYTVNSLMDHINILTSCSVFGNDKTMFLAMKQSAAGKGPKWLGYEGREFAKLGCDSVTNWHTGTIAVLSTRNHHCGVGFINGSALSLSSPLSLKHYTQIAFRCTIRHDRITFHGLL